MEYLSRLFIIFLLSSIHFILINGEDKKLGYFKELSSQIFRGEDWKLPSPSPKLEAYCAFYFKDYLEDFVLDYGSEDNERKPGFVSGMVKKGALRWLCASEPDNFMKWLYHKLEWGKTATSNNRLKPYYAADFGTKADLKKGENPKLIIVNKKLQGDEFGKLIKPSNEIEVEVREIWQPWLKRKCDFVARYIVPIRTNIIEIMEREKRFKLSLCGETENGKRYLWAKMVFKPTLFDKFFKGKKDVVLKHYIPPEVEKKRFFIPFCCIEGGLDPQHRETQTQERSIEMSGMRKDLRNQAQSRAISMHLGGVNEVDGASKYSQGKTSVLATVVGPVVPKFARHENSEKCTVEIEVNYASNLENLNNNGNNISEIAIADFLKSSILPAIQSELFPRKLIVIQVLILQNEGSIFSVALNACVLALLDAAIPMYYYMTCVQIAVISNELFVDPVEEEEKNAEGNLTICIKGSQMKPDEENAENIELMGEKEDKILSMEFSGVVQSNLIEPMVEAACKYSKALSATIRETIATKISTTAMY